MFEEDLKLVLTENGLGLTKELPAPWENTFESNVVISFAVPGSALYRVGIAFCQMQSSGNSMEEGVSQLGFKRAVAFRLPERRRDDVPSQCRG